MNLPANFILAAVFVSTESQPLDLGGATSIGRAARTWSAKDNTSAIVLAVVLGWVMTVQVGREKKAAGTGLARWQSTAARLQPGS